MPLKQAHLHCLHLKTNILNFVPNILNFFPNILDFFPHILNVALGGEILATGLIVFIQSFLDGGGLRFRLDAHGIGLDLGLLFRYAGGLELFNVTKASKGYAGHVSAS